MSDLGRIVGSYLARRKRAEGGEVDADGMIDRARERLWTQPARPVMLDVGEPAIGDGGQFSPGVRGINTVAERLPRAIVDSAVQAVKTPGEMMKPNPYPEGSEEWHFYEATKKKAATDWAPEMALNTMGTGAIMGVPVKGAEAVLGAGPVRTKGVADVVPAGAEARLDVGPGLAGPPGGAEGVRAAELQAQRWAGERAALEGLPRAPQVVEGQPFIPGPVARAHEVADHYMAGRDFGAAAPDKYHPIDVEHAAAIAKAFDEMPHAPNDPQVKAAYQALADETLAQYNAIVEKGGLKVTPVNAADYPYHGNPRAVVKDVADNNHMAFFKTDEGFGSAPVELAEHPLLRPSGVKVGDHEMLYNDLFRVVHDYFGHVKNGYGFRGAGEDNAWRAHAAMYSPEARRAMTTETRGQNSWLNYGPHGEFNRTANAADTIYAPQKIGLLPDWVMSDRVAAPAVAKTGLTDDAGLALKGKDFTKASRATLDEIAAGPKGAGPLDLSSMAAIPDVPQVPMDRYVPPRGVSPRMQAALDNPKVARGVAKSIEEGRAIGADKWYHNEPIRRSFVEELGPAEGQRAFQTYMDMVSATSPRSDVPTNIRNASYYYQHARAGKELPEKLPYPYGHVAQALHRSNYEGLIAPRSGSLSAGAPETGTAWDIYKNPKPASFSQNLQGNLAPGTIDTHAFRNISMRTGDPRFMETSISQKKDPGRNYGDDSLVRRFGEEGKDVITFRPQQLHKEGRLTLKEAQDIPSFWATRPKDNEYAAAEALYRKLGAKAGLPTADAQAAAWAGAGKMTGLASSPTHTFSELFNERVLYTAKMRGEDARKTLKDFITGKKPLLSIAGAAAAGSVLAGQQQPEGYAEGGEVIEDEGGGSDDAAPVFDPAKLAAAKPQFDPAKLAAAKPKAPKTIGERIKGVWDNPSPGGPVWMAKELVEGVKGSVDSSQRAVSTPQTEADVLLQDKARGEGAAQALRAAQFLTPSAPKGAGGIFAAPMRDAAAAKLVSPEAMANRELADEFGFKLSRGQATKDLDQIRYEDMAARDAYGKDAQDKAAGFFNKQYEDIQSGTQNVGQQLARGETPLGSPVNAASSLNREIADSAARSAQTRDEVIARAEQAAAARRAEVTDRGTAIDDSVNRGRPPIAPREAGEAVNTGVRQAAAEDRAYYQAKYEDVARQPGQFEEGTFQGVGSRIRNDLFHAEQPIEITENTRTAHHAIQALDNWSQPNILNAADPTAAFADPTSVVTLKNVDTFMKRLSGFYRQAERGSEDQRAVGAIMREFGNQVENAMADGMFSGDPAAFALLREAKAAFARYQRTYKPQGADEVGNAMRRIVERNATPEETANMIIGSGQVGNAALPVKIATRLQEVLGADSEEYQAILRAMWQKASQVRGKSGEIDPIASAKSIEAFANSTLGRNTFPQQRQQMLAQARGIRDLDRIIETLPETAAAERARSIYQEAFSGDNLSGSQRAVFRRMVAGDATPEETAGVIFNAIGGGNPGDAARALHAIMQIVGPNSPVMNTVRQGVWQKLTQEPFGKDQKGQQKMVQAVHEFINGKGGTIARALYNEEERRLMNRFADAVRLTIIPKYARTNSDTAPALLAAVRKYAGVVGTAIGSVFHGGVSGGAEGYGITKALDFAGTKVGAFRDKKKLSDSLEDVLPTPKSRPLAERRPALRSVPRALPLAGPPAAKRSLFGEESNPYAP